MSWNLQLPLLVNKTILLEEICKVRGINMVGLNVELTWASFYLAWLLRNLNNDILNRNLFVFLTLEFSLNFIFCFEVLFFFFSWEITIETLSYMDSLSFHRVTQTLSILLIWTCFWIGSRYCCSMKIVLGYSSSLP